MLVNEFGEVGLDGLAIADAAKVDASRTDAAPGSDGAPAAAAGALTVQEVPGGCICCTAGPQLRVSLARLLRTVRPDRLIVEPTGLAHPAAVLDTLASPGLAEAVDRRATITLVDVRRLDDPRVRASDTFRDQVAVADVLVGTFVDRASDAQQAAFRDWASALWPPKVVVGEAAHGALDPSWLELDPRPPAPVRYVVPRPVVSSAGSSPPLPHGPTAASWGHRYPPEVVFDRRRLQHAIQTLVAPGGPLPDGAWRLKGVFHTQRVWQRVDVVTVGDDLTATWTATAHRRDSRVEILAPPDSSADWSAAAALLEEARCP